MSTPPYGSLPDGEGQRYPSYQPYGAPPPPPPGPASTNGLAIASMVSSILAMLAGFATCGLACVLGLVGAIMGHVADSQIRRTGEGGSGLATAGIVIGWFSFVLGVLAVVFFVLIVMVIGHLPNIYRDLSATS
ncbi:DUF4190 domain-containing protein [Nocardioides montaniterrae]